MRHVFVILLSALTIGQADAKESAAVLGLDTFTCSHFIESFKKSPTVTESVYFAWALGYMTGQNVSLVKAKEKARDLTGTLTKSQETFLHSYCERHPRSAYRTPVLQLFETLPQVYIKEKQLPD